MVISFGLWDLTDIPLACRLPIRALWHFRHCGDRHTETQVIEACPVGAWSLGAVLIKSDMLSAEAIEQKTHFAAEHFIMRQKPMVGFC